MAAVGWEHTAGDAPYEGIPLIGGFVRALVEGEHSVPRGFLPISSEDVGFRPQRVVQAAASAEALDALAEKAEAAIHAAAEQAGFQKLTGELMAISDSDSWVRRLEGGSYEIANSVVEICAEISRQATETAPRFVTREYEISVAPTPLEYWRANEGRRVRLELVRRRTGKRFDLRVVGSGLAVGASYAIQDAMRRLEEPEIWARPDAMFIFDEPERHLHPAAQDEVVKWLGRLVESGATIALATHALPFLSLPIEDFAYMRAPRSQAGLTEVAALGPDVVGSLEKDRRALGLSSPAQLIQLTRAAIVVEGKHDVMVLYDLYGDEFCAARLRLLPRRHAQHARAY